jgi:DNA-binding protein H-NS
MTTSDDDKQSLGGLRLAELQALLARTNEQIAERRVEELKVLADGYAKKLQMNGFSIREGIDALKPYLPVRRTGSRSG